jgi:hypothetical protein
MAGAAVADGGTGSPFGYEPAEEATEAGRPNDDGAKMGVSREGGDAGEALEGTRRGEGTTCCTGTRRAGSGWVSTYRSGPGTPSGRTSVSGGVLLCETGSAIGSTGSTGSDVPAMCWIGEDGSTTVPAAVASAAGSDGIVAAASGLVARSTRSSFLSILPAALPAVEASICMLASGRALVDRRGRGGAGVYSST